MKSLAGDGRAQTEMKDVPTRQVVVWLEKRALASRWASHEWRVAAVLPPGAPAPVVGAVAVDGLTASLYADEAEGYYLNASSATPVAFVMSRPPETGEDAEAPPQPRFVTLSYNEAARLLDAQERVDSVPLEAGLAAWLADYVAANYRPEPKKRRVKASFLSPDQRSRL